jgi:hypothetical protein
MYKEIKRKATAPPSYRNEGLLQEQLHIPTQVQVMVKVKSSTQHHLTGAPGGETSLRGLLAAAAAGACSGGTCGDFCFCCCWCCGVREQLKV